MGILDSIIGSGSTKNLQEQTGYANQQLFANQDANQGVLNNRTAAATGDLQTGATSALDAIASGYGAGTGAVAGYGAQGQQQLNGRTDQGAASATAGNSGYTPALQSGGAASGALANALGLNGPTGNASATAAFQTSPGYQFGVDQATDAASRSAAAAGSLGSGNTLDAITRLGSHLADSEYQNYLGNLSNLGTQGLTAASGVSANDRAAGTLQGTAGTTGATLLNNTGSALGTLNAAGGSATAGVDTGLGQGSAALQSGLGSSLVANNDYTTTGFVNNVLGLGKAEDTAANTNSGIFSKIIGSLTGLPLGGASSTGGSFFSNLFGSSGGGGGVKL